MESGKHRLWQSTIGEVPAADALPYVAKVRGEKAFRWKKDYVPHKCEGHEYTDGKERINKNEKWSIGVVTYRTKQD